MDRYTPLKKSAAVKTSLKLGARITAYIMDVNQQKKRLEDSLEEIADLDKGSRRHALEP
jgi:hypothetical protein